MTCQSNLMPVSTKQLGGYAITIGTTWKGRRSSCRGSRPWEIGWLAYESTRKVGFGFCFTQCVRIKGGGDFRVGWVDPKLGAAQTHVSESKRKDSDGGWGEPKKEKTSFSTK